VFRRLGSWWNRAVEVDSAGDWREFVEVSTLAEVGFHIPGFQKEILNRLASLCEMILSNDGL